MKSVESQQSLSQRALEKQASREHDLARLKAGEVSAADLRRENGIGSRLSLGRYRMSAIGGRSILRS